MDSRLDAPLERPRASRLLAETRRRSREILNKLDPGQRMQAAFALSLEARKLLAAGLQARGFSEAEIRAACGVRRA